MLSGIALVKEHEIKFLFWANSVFILSFVQCHQRALLAPRRGELPPTMLMARDAAGWFSTSPTSLDAAGERDDNVLPTTPGAAIGEQTGDDVRAASGEPRGECGDALIGVAVV